MANRGAVAPRLQKFAHGDAKKSFILLGAEKETDDLGFVCDGNGATPLIDSLQIFVEPFAKLFGADEIVGFYEHWLSLQHETHRPQPVVIRPWLIRDRFPAEMCGSEASTAAQA